MTETPEKDLTDPFTEALDSAAAALTDADETLDAETADSLRARLADLSSDVDDASVSDLLAAAGVSADDVETADGDEAGAEAEDDGGLTDLPRLLASADDETVDSIRTLLDLADLGEDAPEDDAAFTERLGAILDSADTADDGGATADDGEQTDADAEEIDGDAEGAAVNESDARSEDAEESDGLLTVSDVISGTISYARDLRDARQGVADSEGADADAGDGESDDEDDGGWLDFDDLTPDVEEEEGRRAEGQRGGQGTRFSTMPGRRSDMGRASRFSSIKGRKR